MIDEARAGRYNDVSEAACQWDAVAGAVYGARRTVMVRRPPVPAPGAARCACGATENLDTIAVERGRAALVCEGCVECRDWRGWQFDPCANVYSR
jgi:hypothetical protein